MSDNLVHQNLLVGAGVIGQNNADGFATLLTLQHNGISTEKAEFIHFRLKVEDRYLNEDYNKRTCDNPITELSSFAEVSTIKRFGLAFSFKMAVARASFFLVLSSCFLKDEFGYCKKGIENLRWNRRHS
jgi:hypothetical protein